MGSHCGLRSNSKQNYNPKFPLCHFMITTPLLTSNFGAEGSVRVWTRNMPHTFLLYYKIFLVLFVETLLLIELKKLSVIWKKIMTLNFREFYCTQICLRSALVILFSDDNTIFYKYLWNSVPSEFWSKKSFFVFAFSSRTFWNLDKF